MTSPTRKVEKEIKIFEQAVIPEKMKLTPPNIKKIFLAIDAHAEASEISKNALKITCNLATRFQADVFIACIAPTFEEMEVSEKLVNEAIKLLECENIPVTGTCSVGRPSEHILEISEEFNPNLIILQIPYGERAETFDIESLGATADIVIRKTSFPILLVRKPVNPPDEITKSILVLVDAVKTLKASEFALTLADKGSNLQLLSITEKESIEEIEKLTETLIDSKIDQDALERLHRKEIKALIDGIVSEAKARGVKVERTHLVGEKVKLTLKEAKEKHTIIVLASSLDQNNILETEVENLARLSRIPVLIVKT